MLTEIMNKLYFPPSKRLIKLSELQSSEIILAILRLAEFKFPYKYLGDTLGEMNELEFYLDPKMPKDCLGHTTILHPNRIVLNQMIVNGLTSKLLLGVSSNQHELSIVVHELTHLAQMRNPIKFALLNLPVICNYGNEYQANRNQEFAYDKLLLLLEDEIRMRRF